MNKKMHVKQDVSATVVDEQKKGQTTELWICMQVTNLHNAYYLTAHNDEKTEVCLNFILSRKCIQNRQ